MDYSLAANHRFGDDLEEVSSMTVSSDTKKLICGFPSGSVKIWNLEDKRCICKVDSIHFGPVTGLGITKDGESLVSCSEDGTVSIWELPSFVLKNNLKGHRGGCQGLTLSRDECYLITFSCREFNVWDIKNIQVPILKYHENVIGLKTLALSPDNAYIYTGLEDNSIKVWKREGGQKPANITNAHNLPVEAIACTGDNNYVLSTSGENSIKVWAIAKWPFPLRLYDEIKIEKTDEFIGLGVLTDHKHIVAGSLDGGLKMLNIKTRVCKFNNEDESRLIKLLVTNINQIITCHANKTIKFWDLKGNLQDVISIAHSHGLRSLVATEEQIVSGGGTTDNVVKVWNLNSRICEDSISSPHIYGVSALAVSWDKKYLVTSGLDDEFIKVWKFEIKEYITKIPRFHKTNLTVMGITPGNEHLITGAGDGTIKIWKFLNHEPMLTIENCHSTISGITLSSDGNFFFSSSNEDPIFKIWNIHNGKCVHSFELPLQGKSTAVCISRNWQYVIRAVHNQGLEIWHLPSSTRTYMIESQQKGAIDCLTTTLNDSHIILGTQRGSLQMLPINITESLKSYRESLMDLLVITRFPNNSRERFLIYKTKSFSDVSSSLIQSVTYALEPEASREISFRSSNFSYRPRNLRTQKGHFDSTLETTELSPPKEIYEFLDQTHSENVVDPESELNVLASHFNVQFCIFKILPEIVMTSYIPTSSSSKKIIYLLQNLQTQEYKLIYVERKKEPYGEVCIMDTGDKIAFKRSLAVAEQIRDDIANPKQQFLNFYDF